MRGHQSDDADDQSAGARLADWFHRVWRRGIMRSGLGTGLVLALAAIAFILAYRQHAQGNFHKLKERMAEERPQTPDPRPGGQSALVITRTRLMDDTAPEFLAVTMLPGRGMNVLQISAYIPGEGEIELMDSPSIADATHAMTGQGVDANGYASFAVGSPFTLPWADRLWATWGEGSGHAAVIRQDKPVTLPATAATPLDGGLALASPSDSSNTSTLPDGGQVEASFHGFGGGWPSQTEITIAALLSGHTVDFTVTARNAGDSPEPIGIGWAPRFAVRAGARPKVRLLIPANSRVERDERSGPPTGRLLPVTATGFGYTAHGGAELPPGGLDECFADLQQGVLDNGPAAELIDPVDGYRLRLTALSPEIRAIRVSAPDGGNYITIGPQFNYPDPFGNEWDKAGGSGMVRLSPGQSVEWRVRLEILPLNDEAGTL